MRNYLFLSEGAGSNPAGVVILVRIGVNVKAKSVTGYGTFHQIQRIVSFLFRKRRICPVCYVKDALSLSFRYWAKIQIVGFGAADSVRSLHYLLPPSTAFVGVV